ncbi:MAG: TrmH family RNA methyltransferase [Anaerolineae bacterium]
MPAGITSASNPKVKYVRSLYERPARYREQKFVIEGLRLVEEALRAGMQPALVFYTLEFAGRPEGQELLQRIRERSWPAEQVAPHVMERLSETVTPQGILAVVPFPEWPVPARLELVLIVDGVADPGNLGTLLRSAEAAGVDLVLLSEGTADVFNPKVVRGGMGAHLRLPMRWGMRWEAIAGWVQGLTVYLADVKGSRSYDQVDWTKPAALIVSSEAHGPSPAARRLAHETIYIPMQGQTESLNVGVAGSVILFEAARQRRWYPAVDLREKSDI